MDLSLVRILVDEMDRERQLNERRLQGHVQSFHTEGNRLQEAKNRRGEFSLSFSLIYVLKRCVRSKVQTNSTAKSSQVLSLFSLLSYPLISLYIYILCSLISYILPYHLSLYIYIYSRLSPRLSPIISRSFACLWLWLWLCVCIAGVAVGREAKDMRWTVQNPPETREQKACKGQ